MLLLMHLQDGPFLRASSSASKASNPGLDVCASPPRPSSASLSEERGGHRVLLEKIEAERDDSQSKGRTSVSNDYFHSSNVRGDEEGQNESTVGEKDGDSTTVWSSLELDMNYGHSHKGCAHNRSSSLFIVIEMRSLIFCLSPYCI